MTSPIPSVVRILRLCPAESAEMLLGVFEQAYRPTRATASRVYPDTLGLYLALHTGPDDAPSGCPTAGHGHEMSPLSANLEAFHEHLARGQSLYAFALESAQMPPDDDAGERPRYETASEPPEGWLSVRDVCRQKDVSKSAVARALDQRLVRVAMCQKTRQRYVCPDADYDAWTPRTQTDVLLRRRLLLVRGVLRLGRPASLQALYAAVVLAESERYGAPRAAAADLRDFFERALQDLCPRSLAQWTAQTDVLLGPPLSA